jgi:hypothetical protein
MPHKKSLNFALETGNIGAMKKTLIALLLVSATVHAQLGWESYTGQPTSTLYGSAAGAGLGYFLAPAISKGPDAQWIGALTGLAAGGLIGNYMAGDNNTHQKLMNSGQSSQNKPMRMNNIATGRKQGNTVRSPYSDYVVSAQDYAPGSIVSDPVSGQVFRIPR